jgi:hypothetical protein
MCERFRVICLVLVIVLLQACSWPEAPPRPPNVPLDAVRFGGAKGQWWVKCSYKSGVNACTVFNSGGLVLWDSVYRPYDGGPPVPERELRIVWRDSQLQELHLENGRILIQERVFDEIKGAIELRRGGKR